MSRIHVVAGAMFGSEGKGHVTAQLIENPEFRDKWETVLNIRVAGPNAGHTVIDENGVAFPLRSVPVGAAVDHKATLYIAPGSEIELDVLEAEIYLLREHGHPTRLIVSGEATLLEQRHKDTETLLGLHEKLGSTGKGIGSARADRIMRSAQRIMDSDEALNRLMDIGGVDVLDAQQSLQFMAGWLEDENSVIVIEGTQGYGLGLHAGHYPTCTSSDARAIDFLSMAGISPWAPGVQHTTVWLVARVFPIRVAGKSGPLKGETSWQELGLPEERTTVTHKVRRVGEWDGELMRQAVVANGGATFNKKHEFMREGFEVLVALTMADQKIPSLYGKSRWMDLAEDEADELNTLIREVQDDAGAFVGMIATGPKAVLPQW